MILARRAYEMIARECRTHPHVETGGLLVGCRLGLELVVPFVVPAGDGAVRSCSRFSPDAQAQQLALDFLTERFRNGGRHELDYCGDWHRHKQLPTPSSIDLETAHHIVTDSEWNVIEAVFPIVVIDDRRLTLRAFHISRFTERFTEIPVVVVPDADPRMRFLLLGE